MSQSEEIKIVVEAPPLSYEQISAQAHGITPAVHYKAEVTPSAPIESTVLVENGTTAESIAQQEDATRTVIQTVVVQQVNLGNVPVVLTCSNCQSAIETRLKFESSGCTHCIAFALFCFCWPCSCLPYILDSCKSVTHSCPNCGAYIGTYEYSC